MKIVTSEVTRGQRGGYLSFVKDKYRKGYEIPVLPYQTAGIICRTLWTSKDQIVRIVPGVDKETGKVLRQNKNVQDYSSEAPCADYLTNTFMQATTVNSFGDSRQSFITDYAPGSEDEAKFGGDTLIHWFIRHVWRTVDDETKQGNKKKKGRYQAIPEWKRWVGQRGPITFDKVSLIFQGLGFKINGRDNVDLDKNPMIDENGDTLPLYMVIAIDNAKAAKNLMTALVDPTDPGKPLDALTNNKFGGMAELNGNKLFLNSVDNTEDQWKTLRPSVQAGGKGWVPTPYPLSEEVVKDLWVPWDDLIHYLSADEQATLLAAEFGADTVNYIFGLDPKFSSYEMPEEIAKAGLGRYASAGVGQTQGGTINVGSIKPAGLGFAPAVPAAPAAPVAPATAAAPSLGAGLGSVPKASGVSADKLKAEIAKMKSAGVKTSPTEEQEDTAASLLDDPDLADDLMEGLAESESYAEEDEETQE